MVAKNFPTMDSNFKIYIDGEVVDIKDLNYFPKLEYILDLSDDKKYSRLSKTAKVKKSILEKEFISKVDKNNVKVNFRGYSKTFKISGWIGCIRDLSYLKVINTDELGFTTDNRISIYARGKLGEYNILPLVNTNQGHDAYLIGEIFADFLEDTDYDDIAISSREGYIKSDPRYKAVIEYVKKAVRIIINERIRDKRIQKSKDIQLKRRKLRLDDREFYSFLDKIGDQIDKDSREILIAKASKITNTNIDKEILYGSDSVLISHSSSNSHHADFILELLGIIGVPDDKIIYTSSEIEKHKVPFGSDIFEYLFDEFRKDIYVCFVVDNTFRNRFACVSEAGAAWVTSKNYGVFLADDVKFHEATNYQPLKFSRIGVHLSNLNNKETRTVLRSFKNLMVKRFNLEEPKNFNKLLEEKISNYYNKIMKIKFGHSS